jgi:hypothetical protein
MGQMALSKDGVCTTTIFSVNGDALVLSAILRNTTCVTGPLNALVLRIGTGWTSLRSSLCNNSTFDQNAASFSNINYADRAVSSGVCSTNATALPSPYFQGSALSALVSSAATGFDVRVYPYSDGAACNGNSSAAFSVPLSSPTSFLCNSLAPPPIGALGGSSIPFFFTRLFPLPVYATSIAGAVGTQPSTSTPTPTLSPGSSASNSATISLSASQTLSPRQGPGQAGPNNLGSAPNAPAPAQPDLAVVYSVAALCGLLGGGVVLGSFILLKRCSKGAAPFVAGKGSHGQLRPSACPM